MSDVKQAPEKHRPKGSYAVMAERRDPTDALDFFPTPPWATRALCERVLSRDDYEGCSVWEPAAGEGHMAEVLREYFGRVHASDVHDYGKGYAVGSFVGEGADRATMDYRPDWIITNPPFNLGIEFALRAMDEARFGCALLLRSVWSESQARYREIFSRPDRKPTIKAEFSERVAMLKGRWDPKGSTATSYAWFVWRRGLERGGRTELVTIGPCKTELTRPDDAARFASAETSNEGEAA